VVERELKNIFSEEDLAYFNGLLYQKRDELLNKSQKMIQSDIAMDRTNISDEIDLASVMSEQSITLRFLDRDLKLLKQINQAIRRIEDGSYGYCEGTGEMIPRKRLEARPWCKYSVKYKEMLEKEEAKRKSSRNGFTSELLDD
jgi:DnaK suppressor protein